MPSLVVFFGDLKAPRRSSHADHPLLTVVALVLLSMLCGAQGWDDMHLWSWSRRAWLATLLDLSADVPSADTFRRVMSALDPKAFRQGFEAWTRAVVERMPDLHVAVDGKTIRGSQRLGLPAVHVMRAFVVNNSLVL